MKDVHETHPLFRGVFEDWQTKAGVLSARPDAPVVADDSPSLRLALRRLRARFGRPPGNSADSDTRRLVHPHETSMPPHIG
ncbi:hypothetical protein [Streptomyces guryensis]|uniref:Uncharacterized protein n=1 Tax=Streptomyces guryensis TaxID=2886947 RepID=A0A9Q3Z3D4_9ACTN|nr:hypothetical protein [Streptomyces guryensis]MCD9872321.1 hypothetical protein [Streptomyces guryensis]